MAYKRSRREFEADVHQQASPFVYYGTPLPPLDDNVRDDGSYVPAWKQEVTDDRGRKRLHGAFTGGFSAGYFNTVGSKEGWTPAAFVSSRKNRAADTQTSTRMRPEDFMDEEDLKEQEESQKLSTISGFAGFGTEADPSQQDALADLFKSSEDSMGIKLMNRMGWRQGQGIGPKLRRRTDPDDPVSEFYLVAPEDPPMISFNRKSDFKGLGYSAEVSTEQSPSLIDKHEDDPRPHRNFVNQREQRSEKRTAMGVGVLNDTGSDDEDPYAIGPRISYNRVLGGDKKFKTKNASSIAAANPLVKTKATFLPKKTLSVGLSLLRKCHDGRLPLSGFVLADELDIFKSMKLTDDKYKPDEVPSDWKPSNVTASDASVPDTGSYTSTSDAAKVSAHTAKSRAAVLGEASLPGKSVFDYLSPAARERLAGASGRTDLPPARNEASSTANESISTNKSLFDLIPVLDPTTAQAALDRGRTGFMPYSDELSKRERYQKFLEISAKKQTTIKLPPRAPGHSNDDWANEMNEFARAASVFKPVTGLMASRFTSATNSTTLHTQVNIDNSETKDLLTRPSDKPADPAEEAARLGMFGPATRTTTNFYPTRLLCKRYGVSLPDHATTPQNASTRMATNQDTGSRFETEGYQFDETHKTPAGPVSTSIPMSLEEKDTGSGTPVPVTLVIDPDRNEALEQERPGAAVFKAIFGSDDEDEEEI